MWTNAKMLAFSYIGSDTIDCYHCFQHSTSGAMHLVPLVI